MTWRAMFFNKQLSQISGVGQVLLAARRCQRYAWNSTPQALFKYGIGLEDVRAALAAANANSPKGTIDDDQPAFPDLHQ